MAKRTDNNQTAIVNMLREFGASVVDLHEVGHGCPDIVVGHHGKNYLMEIKSESGRLTPAEQNFKDTWRGNYYIIYNIEDALKILCER